jgi:hypothetical protein
MAGSPSALRELRYRSSSALKTSFQNAAAAYWNTDNAEKLEITAYDASGLVQEGLEDITLQTRKHSKGSPTVGLAKGSLKFSTYLQGADSGIDIGPGSQLLNVLMGNLQATATARTATVGANSTTTNINITGVNGYVVAGQAALCGVRNDGKGMGEVKPINAVGTDWIGLSIATNAALASGDTVAFSDTAYFDEDQAQEYLEVTSIGHATADQRQAHGAGIFALTMGQGERPSIDVDVAVADHRHVPTLERSSFTSGTNPSGNDPAFSGAIGLIHIGDHGDSTRTQRMGGDITFDPGLVLQEKMDPAGPSGVGEYVKMPSVPSLELSLYYDEDMDGLASDYNSATAKTALIQMGHVQGKCVAIELPKCYLDNLPDDGDLNGLMAVKVTLHGDEDFIDGSDIRSAAGRIHML